MAPPPVKAMRAPAPAVRLSSPVAARSPSAAMSSTAMFAQRTGGSNQRALAAIEQGKQATANDSAPVPLERMAKLPALSDEVRVQIDADIEGIVRILKRGTPDSGDQTNLLEAVRRWERKDRELPAANRAGRRTPLLDHFLLRLKMRAYSRSNFRSLWQDQYVIAYDTLWYELRGYWLEEFKRVVKSSETQRTEGAEAKEAENGAALIAKQEAMGMWGMLKGMGTGLVSIAGPQAAQYIGEQFDETAHIMFGHEWDSSEPLVWGMNAAQIGTAGGDVILQLVMFSRTLGAKGDKMLQLINNLDKFKKAQQVLATLGGVQGMLMATKGLVQLIQAKRAAGEKITAKGLIHDPAFVNQLVMLVSSGIGTAMAVKGAPSAQQGAIHARVAVLLSSTQITASISELSEIAQSDKSDIEKELEYGRVLSGLIPQLVSLIIAGHGHAQARKEAKVERQQQAQDRAAAVAKAQQEAAAQLTPPETLTKAPLDTSAEAGQKGTFKTAAQEAKRVLDDSPPAPGLLQNSGLQTATPLAHEPAAAAMSSESYPQTIKDIPLSPQAQKIYEFELAKEAMKRAAAEKRAPLSPASTGAGVPSDVPPAHVIDFLARQKASTQDPARLQLEIPQALPRAAAAAGESGMSMSGKTGESTRPMPSADAQSSVVVIPAPGPHAATNEPAAPAVITERIDERFTRGGLSDPARVADVAAPPTASMDVAPIDLPVGPSSTTRTEKTIGRPRPSAEVDFAASAAPVELVEKTIGKRSPSAAENLTTTQGEKAAERSRRKQPRSDELETFQKQSKAKKEPAKTDASTPIPPSKSKADMLDRWTKGKEPTQGKKEASRWKKKTADVGKEFVDLGEDVGTQKPTPHKRGVKAAMKDAEGFPKGEKPGEVNMDAQAHKDASDVREIKKVKGADFQSVHGGATSWLNKRIWRNNELISINYSRADAITTLLPPNVHQSFDRTWKSFAIETRQAGIDRVPASEMLRVMRQAVANSTVGGAQQGSLMMIIESEFSYLGIDVSDIVELPYTNVKPL